jgi:hypothetical protein
MDTSSKLPVYNYVRKNKHINENGDDGDYALDINDFTGTTVITEN